MAKHSRARRLGKLHLPNNLKSQRAGVVDANWATALEDGGYGEC